ncbi:hypothetical protein [Escherichia coli]|uniref:hypothetical protein n=1 Tax=Escherichia coli TaxID=562 RepID=UPI00388D4DD7
MKLRNIKKEDSDLNSLINKLSKTNRTTKITEEDTIPIKIHNNIVRTGAMQAKLKKLNKHPYLFFKDAIKNIGVKTKKIIINAKGSQMQ